MKRNMPPGSTALLFGSIFILMALTFNSFSFLQLFFGAFGIFEFIMAVCLYVKPGQLLYRKNILPKSKRQNVQLPLSTTVKKRVRIITSDDGEKHTIITCTSEALIHEIAERDYILRKLHALDEKEKRITEEQKLKKKIEHKIEEEKLNIDCSVRAFQQILTQIPRVIITPDKDAIMQPLALSDFFPNISGVRSNQSVKRLRDFVVIDVETTGLNPGYERIVQISALRFIDFRVAELFETYVKPSVKIPLESQSIHHITDDMVKNAPRFCEIQSQLAAFIGDSYLVGHNIYFDLKFLRKAGYDSACVKRLYLDTLKISQAKDEIFSHKLVNACKHHNIHFDTVHSSTSDALACGLLFLAYLKAHADSFCGIKTEYDEYRSFAEQFSRETKEILLNN